MKGSVPSRVKFTNVNEKEPKYELINVKVKQGSTLFYVDLLSASILFTCVRTCESRYSSSQKISSLY